MVFSGKIYLLLVGVVSKIVCLSVEKKNYQF